MATLISLGGNFTASASWALCNATAEQDGAENTRDTNTSAADSNTFTPGAITVDGVAIKVFFRNGATTGTVTVTLRNSTDAVDVTSVTFNASDVDSATGLEQSVVHGGWIFLKFSASQTLIAGKAYLVRIVSSVNNNLKLVVSSGSDWARQLRTTTTQAPASGDKLIICGERTGAGAGALTPVSITMDSTSSATSYGSASFKQSIAVSHGGTFALGTAASTAYLLKVAGNIFVFAGGTMSFGTVAAPLPSTSSFVLTMNVVSNGDSSIEVRGSGQFLIEGAAKTNYYSLLTADKAAAATVLALQDTTGWANGDELAIAPTTRSSNQLETKTISTVDSSTQVTLTAGLTNAHGGQVGIQAEVANLNRNISIVGISNSLKWLFRAWWASQTRFRSCVFKWFATGFGTQFRVDVVSGSLDTQYCVFRNATSRCITTFQTGADHITISRNTFYDCVDAIELNATTPGSDYHIDYNLYLGDNGGSAYKIINSHKLWNFIGNKVGSCSNVGFSYTAAAGGTFDGFVIHSCGQAGVDMNAGAAGQPDFVVKNFDIWRLNNYGFSFNNDMSGALFDSCNVRGCNDRSINVQGNVIGDRTLFRNCNFAGDTSFATNYGVHCLNNLVKSGFEFENCNFGLVSGFSTTHATRDLNWDAGLFIKFILRNCVLNSTNKLPSPTNMKPGSSVNFSRWQQLAESHRTYFARGLGQTDHSIYNTAAPSERLTPNSADYKLKSTIFPVPVDPGQVISVSVNVRKSAVADTYTLDGTSVAGANYNGNQPRLILKANPAIGINSDTMLSSMSASLGSWELLIGVAPAATDYGALEFYVDLDGTTGWINIDDWEAH